MHCLQRHTREHAMLQRPGAAAFPEAHRKGLMAEVRVMICDPRRNQYGQERGGRRHPGGRGGGHGPAVPALPERGESARGIVCSSGAKRGTSLSVQPLLRIDSRACKAISATRIDLGVQGV